MPRSSSPAVGVLPPVGRDRQTLETSIFSQLRLPRHCSAVHRAARAPGMLKGLEFDRAGFLPGAPSDLGGPISEPNAEEMGAETNRI